MEKVVLLECAGSKQGTNDSPVLQQIVCQCKNEEYKFVLSVNVEKKSLDYFVFCASCSRISFVVRINPYTSMVCDGGHILIPPPGPGVTVQAFVKEATGLEMK